MASLPVGWGCCVVENTEFPDLPRQVDAICAQLNIMKVGDRFPKILTDIVAGVVGLDGSLRLVIFEIKGPFSSVGIKDYFQMFGYIHAAELVGAGVLLLIADKPLVTPLSMDLRKVVDGGWLPCNWRLRNLANGREREYIAGIAHYLEGAHIDWVDLAGISGLCNWEDLASALCQTQLVANSEPLV